MRVHIRMPWLIVSVMVNAMCVMPRCVASASPDNIPIRPIVSGRNGTTLDQAYLQRPASSEDGVGGGWRMITRWGYSWDAGSWRSAGWPSALRGNW